MLRHALSAVVLLLSAAAVGAAGAEASPPNIVLIYADDLGYGDLGSYGHHTIQTPHLDRLAEQGVRFTNYYAPAPLCSPSRAGLLTGRTPFRTGIRSWIPAGTPAQLEAAEVTLATLLKGVGYETYLGGKWHLNAGLDQAQQTQPQDHGFDHWLAMHAFPIPHNRNPTNFFRNGEPLGEVEGYTAQIVVDESIAWLEGRQQGSDREAPFFMYLAMIEPHSTHANPEEYNARYAPLTRGVPEPIVNGLPEPPVELLEARGPGEYYANVTCGRKGDLWEGGIRQPAMIRWPGVTEPGTVSDAIVSGYDFLPTLAAIAGFPVPEDRPIDGEDFSAVLRGEEFARARPLYWEFDDVGGFHYALRDGDWKLLADEGLARLELYNLAIDPHEVIDFAAKEPQVLASMVGKLRRQAESVRTDPLLPDWVQTNREGLN